MKILFMDVLPCTMHVLILCLSFHAVGAEERLARPPRRFDIQFRSINVDGEEIE